MYIYREREIEGEREGERETERKRMMEGSVMEGMWWWYVGKNEKIERRTKLNNNDEKRFEL